ncbi:MAG: DEAD/DEAH box helicase family protein [Acidobacteria bacterium]|nr:DEAD/DEAH box helicase family protein [Acidobacteriota bacterium]
MQSLEKYFTPAAVIELRKRIRENNGMEIFCLGIPDESFRIVTIQVIARGNDISVPAVLEVATFGSIAIHNHPSGNLTPSNQDVGLAGEFGSRGVGSFIVDNDVGQLHVLVEPFRSPAIEELQPEDLIRMFEADGLLAKAFEGFEIRPQQVAMVRDVVQSFNQKKIGLIEAGTGVGKSLAYLIPAATWAIRNKQRVVVSTKTINLQEQLILKDIPFLQKGLKLDFHSVLLKGRSNYLCLRKAHDQKKDFGKERTDDNQWELDLIFDWMEASGDGSLSDLSIVPTNDIWDLVCCEADNCSRARCPYFNKCFFYQSRREAAKAQLIVVNHHLLMADLALREQTGRQVTGVIPAFHKLVIDEAHHLEEVATSYLGMHVTPFSFYRNLSRLQHIRHAERGVIPGISLRLYELMNAGNQMVVARLHQLIDQTLYPARKKCQQGLEKRFQKLIRGILQQEERALGRGEEFKKRISDQVEGSALWHEVIVPGIKEIIGVVAGFVEVCQSLLRALRELDQPALEQLDSRILDLEALVLRLKIHMNSLEGFLDHAEEDCRWLEIRRRKEAYHIAFRQAPLRVAGRLKSLLFDAYEAVILTSATLTIDGKFDFIKSRVGLDALPSGRLVESMLESPFDYRQRVLLGIPTDFPDPKSSGFLGALPKLIQQSVEITEGRTFVLFTAYGTLHAVYRLLENELILKGYTCLRQGQMNRHQLLDEFRKSPRCVLFATDSFWEGVDVRGDALQCVILTKLPFQVPSEPIVEARVEKIRRDGGEPFFEYTLPHAVIKLKQGFGRLIRSKEDWGIVLISDHRLMTKAYGRVFLKSLPLCKDRRLEMEPLLEEVRLFRERMQGRSSPHPGNS